jgi:protocatechuate 4,5-dioxygenase alpha chain
MSKNWLQSMPTPEAYWIDRVLFDLQHKPAEMERFQGNPEAYLADIPLSEAHKASIREGAFAQLYLAGANPYLLRAYCLALGIGEAEYLAEMRSIAKELSHG